MSEVEAPYLRDAERLVELSDRLNAEVRAAAAHFETPEAKRVLVGIGSAIAFTKLGAQAVVNQAKELQALGPVDHQGELPP